MTTRALQAQAKAEVAMTLRRGESLLLAIGIPVILLVFFSSVSVLPVPDDTSPRVDYLAPGILALAVMSTSMVSLAIATAFERSYGVLKRLGTTPLSRRDLLIAKTIGVVAVEVLQVLVLVPIAIALGWRPGLGGAAQAVAACLLATIAFSGIALLMAGTLRAEAVLALANGLYLILLLLGGMVIPVSSLPRPLEVIALALPGSALADALHASLGRGAAVPTTAWVVLSLWAVASSAAAAVWFRWD